METTKILSVAQIARSLLQKFYPSRNLREACYKNFIRRAICAELATIFFSLLKNENTLYKKMTGIKNKTDMKHVKTRLIESLLRTGDKLNCEATAWFNCTLNKQ